MLMDASDAEVDNATLQNRLQTIEKRYKELQELASLRKQRLLDALAMYRLLNEAENVQTWITEKEKLLSTLVPGKGCRGEGGREGEASVLASEGASPIARAPSV